MNSPSAPGELRSDVVRFVLDTIDSVSELEMLLLLRRTSPEVWRHDDLTKRLYISPDEAAAIVAKLSARGLVISSDRADDTVAFSKSSPDETVLANLEGAYRTQLTLLSRLIHSKPSPSVREFARAFTVRQEIKR